MNQCQPDKQEAWSGKADGRNIQRNRKVRDKNQVAGKQDQILPRGDEALCLMTKVMIKA